SLRGLDAHRYLLRVLAFGYRALETQRAQAPATRVALKMSRTHVVRGVVTGPNGAPQQYAKIVAISTGGADSSPVHVWTSDASVRYAIDTFQPGSYLMWAQRGDRVTYPPMRLALEAEDLEPLEVELKLDHEGALVTGIVLGEDGRPLSGVHVRLSPRWP